MPFRLLILLNALAERLQPRDEESDRGDVPGWVLVTVMTAGLVAALAAVAGPKLTHAFNAAISSVTG